jgi:hypothetical protein
MTRPRTNDADAGIRDGGGETPRTRGIDAELRTRLEALIEEGLDLFDQFDREVRTRHFHPFIAADYERVLQTLISLREQGVKFLEWGSASGVITIMADLLGFDAYGIELDASLVAVARALAERHGSRARFVSGSFIPSGYRWKPTVNDEGRHGTIGDGTSAYAELGYGLDDFDLVYAYPWSGEEPMMLDLMRCYGDARARVLLNGDNGVVVYRGGVRETPAREPSD